MISSFKAAVLPALPRLDGLTLAMPHVTYIYAEQTHLAR
jgi:hypothetical protein